MIKETFLRRFDELEKKINSLQLEKQGANDNHYSPNGDWQMWATSAQNLILNVFGESTPHYTHFVRAYDRCITSQGLDTRIHVLKNLFLSAKEDFEGGYVFDVDLRVSGEVFGDFVALARQAMVEGHKDVAAVLACAALEDALKRYAAVNELDVDSKTMQEVVNSLKTKGLVAGAQKTLLDAMPKIRNLAMHAEWSKISEPDVSSVLGFVEQFLLTKFSPN